MQHTKSVNSNKIRGQHPHHRVLPSYFLFYLFHQSSLLHGLNQKGFASI